MAVTGLARDRLQTGLIARYDVIRLRTRDYLEFIDLTDPVVARVRASGLWNGIVSVQTRHTTTGLVVNENEPLLISDLRRTLERLAPRHATYEHDDLARRQGPLPPDEPLNGHSHCKALFLRTSESIHVVDGSPQLGRWQRLFLIELDSPRERTVSVMIMGDAGSWSG
jgi:secondary thiamine-phosphate synthase enzyme